MQCNAGWALVHILCSNRCAVRGAIPSPNTHTATTGCTALVRVGRRVFRMNDNIGAGWFQRRLKGWGYVLGCF